MNVRQSKARRRGRSSGRPPCDQAQPPPPWGLSATPRVLCSAPIYEQTCSAATYEQSKVRRKEFGAGKCLKRGRTPYAQVPSVTG